LPRFLENKTVYSFFETENQSEQLIKTLFVRKFIFLPIVLFVTILSTQHVNAQISATAETTAKIVSGLQITKEADLNFGSMFKPTTGGGTVTVNINNQRTASTGVQLADTGEAITAAQFKVTGAPNATITIEFPYSFSVTNTDGSGSSMLVDGFTYNNITSPSTLDGNGEKIIKIGATLHVYNYQALGTYKNTTDLKITVVYN
jgi:hypothetical protein